MDPLFNDLKDTSKIEKMFEAIENKVSVNLSNVKIGLKGFLALLTYDEVDKNVLYITHSDREAQKKVEVLSKFYGPEVLYYPLEPVHDYFSDAHSQNIAHQRMQVIEKLFSNKKYIIIASIDSILKKMMPVDILKNNFLTITHGDIFELDDLVNQLVSLGYERVYQVESKGQFALRGGILDVYNVTLDEAIRFEFFDDEVDSIRLFDVDSQLSIDHVEEVSIAPSREIILTMEERTKILKLVHKKYDNNDVYVELVEKLEQEVTGYDETLFTFVKKNVSFIDYVGDCITIWDEYTRAKETYDIYIKKTWLDYESLIMQGFIFPEEKNKFYSLHHIEKDLEDKAVIKENLFNSRGKKGLSLDMNSKDLESFAGQLPLFLKYIEKRIAVGYRVHICCKNEKTKENVRQYFVDQEIFNFVEGNGSGIHLSVGEISEGFEMEDEKIIYINESEIFKEKRSSVRKKKNKGRKIDSFAELHIGDYVVHDVHGIGIYRGIEQMTITDVTKDLMVIEYAGDAKLYIPVEQMDTVQVYIGTGDKKPKINQMGNPDWQKAKNKAQKAVEDMADELIELYAKRRALKGYAFGPDTSWQKEFEDDFPYVETDDQLRSVEEIKMDMESDIPMDRLLCGDVGYGKTEVALRAAFKAIMEGKQVALLVPTTILAQQHYYTLLDRFKKYPISTEVISRFRTSKQQKKIIEDLITGKLDIIVGTHRLLSKDVHFKDLGLLIVDEEQRFGVRSKEKIKQLKENVDVLTLSATPIPRTLHMSMTGVRDMSVIEEPPAGRRPVQTYVMAYNPLIIQDAINRELGRGGQVYYVHNRVYDINEVGLEVQKMVPDARIIVAHGRMSGSELEDIMTDFLNRDYDILVTTTIIESGLDVKNANTMIIDDGDRFGLSQLYQLRGRVGRSDVQAYAYVTHKKEVLTEIAQKRLKAIKDFTAFGSGFKVAMRDLEIRGAGNILGSEQSGHLFKIGYELYCRILEETITRRMDGVKTVETEEPIRIILDVNGYIPEQYISSEELKYDIYKKLTYIRSKNDYDDFEEELLDRFGDIPDGVYNLMSIAMVKNMASAIGVKEIKQRGKLIYFTFSDKKKMVVPDAEKVPLLFKKYNVKFKAGKTDAACWSIIITGEKDQDVLKQIINFFEDLY
ncbi:MAG: transcription-repair coupling factor [Eubacterium sp.]